MNATNSAGPVRTYGQYCPIAVGLDLLGDRWTLLICRELTMGDRRFTDLRKALPGLAPNLLTERLRALQAEGLVDTAELPPPAARTVYRLTEDGQHVVPLLRALSRFGVRYLDPHDGAMPAARAANALLLAFKRPSEMEARVRLVLGPDDQADIVVTSNRSRVELPSGDADLTVVTTSDALIRARQGEPLVAEFAGTAARRKAFLDAFDL